jgi:hypothetical protein
MRPSPNSASCATSQAPASCLSYPSRGQWALGTNVRRLGACEGRRRRVRV